MTRSLFGDYSPSPMTADPADAPLDEDEVLPPHEPAAADDAPLRAYVPEALGGERLDKVLARLFPAYSRARLQAWIENGRVTIDGVAAPARIRAPATPGALIEVAPQALPEELAFVAEPVALRVVYEDAALVVLDKPAGLVVHPGAGNWSGTMLNGLLHRYPAAAGLPRAGIVHRLDKDTSGLIVVARTLTAQTDLVRQLQARTVRRRYVALVWGTPPEQGEIDAPIGRDPRDRLRMAVVPGAAGKTARTHFQRLATGVLAGSPVAVLQCDLDTGRTHQIRVHCTDLGHPLVGDTLYTGRRRAAAHAASHFDRQALHAWRLGLVHPDTGAALAWECPLPPDMAALFEAAGLPAGPGLFARDAFVLDHPARVA